MASQITNDDLTLSVLKPELGVPVTYRPIKPVLPKPAPAPLTLATITPITNPKTSAGTTAKSAPKGTPVQLWNLAVTTEPYKVNNTMYIIVSVTFSFDAGDPNYGGADIWFAGYHGNTVPALVASGQSEPLSFLVDATGEYIVVTAVAVSPGGVRAPFSGSPQVAITLSPVSAQPPAPTVAQTLIALPGGFYQFGFSYLSGILSTIIAGYNIYQNTSNTFSGATKIKTVPQDPTATGSYYFQISIGTLAASTYYYFVTAVDVFGNESAATSAQSGAVVTSTTLDSVPDGTLYSKTNPQMTQAGVCPVSAATAISNSLTSGGALSQWVQGNSITVLPGVIEFDISPTAGGITDVLLYASVTGSNPNGYIFRFDSRSGYNAGQILICPNGSFGNIGTQKTATNSSNLSGWHHLRILVGNGNRYDIFVDGIWQCTAVDATYTPTGAMYYGYEIHGSTMASTGFVSKTMDTLPNGTIFIKLTNVNSDGTLHKSTALVNQGSLASAGSYTFSYTSTTTSISWSWAAFTCYAPDGSTISVAASSSAVVFSGLTASSTYYFGMYVTMNYDGTGTGNVVMSDMSSGKAAESLVQIMTVTAADGCIQIAINVTAATPSSGSGGGTGNGGEMTCFSPNTKVHTPHGGVRFDELKIGDLLLTARGTWLPVTKITRCPYDGPALDMGDGELVTLTHLFLDRDLWVPVLSLDKYIETHFTGEIWNAHLETGAGDDGTYPDTEHSYTLANGEVVHNFWTK